MVDTSTASAPPELEQMRCRSCKRLLLKISRVALRPGARLETKCNACNAFNYLIGPDDDPATT